MSELKGWLPAEVAAAMQQQISDHRPTLCVEVGVFGGQSLICIAEALRQARHGKVWGIDPWSNSAVVEGFPRGVMDGWGPLMDLAERFKEVMQAVTDRQLWDFVRVIPARSQDCCHFFEEETVDFLHIDGNHSEARFTDDAIGYVHRLLRPGGFVWVDDVGWAREFQGIRVIEGTCNHVKDFERYRLWQKRPGGGHIGR